ncbi:glycosyltransferase 61 family protein [Azospirillum sp. TSO22-1]|uniref:glycosyltransferase family 61 protein n=1 Tax=Azospirillum sp. TSO22-1 TaxID=716789 RepID=UPI001304D2E6|nr:glycosyltransferase 61 family protein [Azospirillum sp. TSO22-1]
MEAHNAGRYDDAIALYRTALALDPGLNDARHLLGLACGRNGRILEGLRLLHGALRAAPGHAIAQANLNNLRASVPYTLMGMARLADAPPPRGDGADLEPGRAWCAAVHSDEAFRIERLPTVVAAPDRAPLDLLAQAGYPCSLEQRAGTATLAKLDDVHLDAGTGIIFDDRSLFLESCSRVDPATRIEDVDFGSPGSVFSYTDQFIVEAHTDFETGARTNRFFVQTALVEGAPLIRRPSIWLGGTSNYYHWMLENLTRVQVVRDFGIDDRTLQYAVEGRPTSMVVETLGALGIDRDRILFLPPRVHRFRSLLVPSMLVPESRMAPRSIRFLRAALPAAPHPDLPRRIYVSRKDATMRRVANEAEILERLKPFGVVDVSLSAMPPARQRALFAGAELVVGPHGAGFANLAFCRPRTPVVELSPHRWHPCFGELSDLVPCRHHVVFPRREVQKAARVPITFDAGTNPLSMEFDPATVEQAVRRALAPSDA